MTKSNFIKKWIIYIISLIISIILYIFLNNNITLSIMLIILIIPFLSIFILLINKIKLDIKLNSLNEFNLNELKNINLNFNKFIFLSYLNFEVNEINLNIESLDYKSNYDIFLGFENKVNINLNSSCLGKYELLINNIYLEDIFKLFRLKINVDLNDFFYLKDDFNKNFNLIDFSNINEDIFKNSNYYKLNNEFDEFNKYKEGDPINLINWKMSSKMEDLFVKVSKDGINNNLIVILDEENLNSVNFNEYLIKYFEIIKYLINKNIKFNIGFYSFKINEFIEEECHDLKSITDIIFNNLYIKENNLDILNYYLNNSLSKKIIYLVTSKKIIEKGVVIIN